MSCCCAGSIQALRLGQLRLRERLAGSSAEPGLACTRSGVSIRVPCTVGPRGLLLVLRPRFLLPTPLRQSRSLPRFLLASWRMQVAAVGMWNWSLNPVAVTVSKQPRSFKGERGLATIAGQSQRPNPHTPLQAASDLAVARSVCCDPVRFKKSRRLYSLQA